MTTAAPPDTEELTRIYAEGRALLADQPAEAAERARTIVAVLPHNADGYRLLGAALRRLGDDSAANEAELAAIHVASADPALRRAAEALLADDLSTAEGTLRQIL